MKLDDYFKQLKETTLSSERKDALFSRIQEKKFQKLLIMNHFFSFKKIAYSVIIVFLTACIFGNDFLQRDTVENNIFKINSFNDSQVFAWNLAEIIDFTGEFFIKKGSQTITSKYIQENNLISLKEHSAIVFSLPDGTQGKITWPAEFVITKDKQIGTYKISLLSGTFLKIFNQTPKIDIEIEMDDLVLEQKKEEQIDLKIVKKEKEIIIDNKGGNVVVNTTKKEKKKSDEPLVVVNTNEAVNINENNITLLKDNSSLIQFIEENNISESFSLQNKEINTWSNLLAISGVETIKDILSHLSGTINDITGEIQTGDFMIDIHTGKLLLTDAENKVIVTLLDDFFLENELEEFENVLTLWDEWKIKKAESSLVREINDIITTFAFDLNPVSSLEEIIDHIDLLKTKLDEKYYISPSYLNNLDLLKEKCKAFVARKNTIKEENPEPIIVEEVETHDPLDETVINDVNTGTLTEEEQQQIDDIFASLWEHASWDTADDLQSDVVSEVLSAVEENVSSQDL